MTLLAVIASLVFLYSLVSRRVERWAVTAPMVFSAAGMLAYRILPEARAHRGGSELFLHVAEVGLVLLLFADASRTDLRVLRSIRNLPARLLSTGMLLTIALGAIAAWLVFPGLSVWQAGILAAILAPTDAGLGQVIVTSPDVPRKIRQALNVEAGLNDGLSVPFLLFFLGVAESGSGGSDASLLRFVAEQLGFGALIGLGLGLPGGWLLDRAHRRGWLADAWRPLGLVTLPLLCIPISSALSASMFIAAFVAGLAVQRGYEDVARHSVELTEEWGQLVNLTVFFLFGVLLASAAPSLAPAHFVYAVLSLTVVRMVPVAVALVGTGLSRATVLFMGWFGPRGLASIVLGLVYLEQRKLHGGDATIELAVGATVLLSIFAHGASAVPGIAAYARSVRSLREGAPELEGA